MIYGYIRVSTDKQDTANQSFQIKNFCKANNIMIGEWVEETISSRQPLPKRQLFHLLKKMKSDDIMIACEISRLGRNLMEVMSILHDCMNRGLKVWTIKDNYRLGNDISSKVLAFAFSLSAEIERTLISQRIKEALARKKAEGKILGRPKGSKKKNPVLLKHLDEVLQMKNNGASQISIAKKFKVHRHTVKELLENFSKK